MVSDFRPVVEHESSILEYTLKFFLPSLDPPPLAGSPVELIDGASQEAQSRRLHAVVTKLINEEVNPASVVVLVGDSPRKNACYELLAKLPLPGSSSFYIERRSNPNHVLVDTVSRFKGLEASVVVLWGLDTLDSRESTELFYVGLSRPTSRL